ncbi:hypothetical protein CGSMWGv55152_04960 [Gardnerella vaginalis 55152]|uniref:Uncharacterized protein n=1 Tax=Gardnerella vaginalis 55152 TaxID=698955 RepID=I4LRY5_GARVA|nr:hypothetical protein [Gardnerella vaginalis]EIK79725.1 hypothetical protein CGSMWGv55152_04960 [Gardnerella vaginalis 55152]
MPEFVPFFGSNGKQKREHLPVFVPIFGVLVNKSGDYCLCLFMFWVEWETNAGMIARVCLCIGLSGKQKREHFPEFVYVLGDFGNKRGRCEEVSAAIRARDNDAVNSTRRGANLAKIRKEFLTILITC